MRQRREDDAVVAIKIQTLTGLLGRFVDGAIDNFPRRHPSVLFRGQHRPEGLHRDRHRNRRRQSRRRTAYQ
jgi:hypothetical protein